MSKSNAFVRISVLSQFVMSDHEALGLPERQGAWIVAAYIQVNPIDTQAVGDFCYGLYKE